MANPARGEMTLDIGGKTYRLVLNIGALAELEDVMSTPERLVFFPETLERVNRGSMKATRALIWASLRTHHPDMTLEKAGDLIEQAGGVLGFTKEIVGLAKSTEPNPADVAAVGADTARPRKAQARSASGTGSASSAMRGTRGSNGIPRGD